MDSSDGGFTTKPFVQPLTMEITAIEVWAHHGVYDSEKHDGQVFFVDVTWWVDPTRIADDLARTIDYSAVTARVVALMQGEPVDLIETAADHLCRTLADEFGMEQVQVSVHKPHAPLGANVRDVSCTTSVYSRTRPSRQVVFSLGSNIEPRREWLQFAASVLGSTSGFTDVRVSPVFQTSSVGTIAQADFLNAILIAHTCLPPLDLLRRALHVESLAKRRRDIPHGPRTLDIDLICVEGETWRDAELTLPHPRARERAFVLLPWAHLEPDAILDGERVSQIIATADATGAFADQHISQLPGQLFIP